MEDVFTVENDVLVIHKDYVRGIPEFKAILERDKGSKSDADGRKKFRAWKEFMYLYIRASLFSYPNKGGYSEKDCHIAAVKESELEANYKPDAEMKAAIEKYKAIHKDILPTLNTIATILRGLRLADMIAKGIVENIEETIELVNKKKATKEHDAPVDLLQDIATTSNLISQLDQVLAIGNKLPKTIETLESLENRLKKEVEGQNIARGGHEVGNRADPKPRK